MNREGRKPLAQELGLLELLKADPLPDMGSTPTSIQRFVRDVAARVGSGRLDRATGETVSKLARSALAAWTAEQARRKADEPKITTWVGERVVDGLALGEWIEAHAVKRH